GAVFGARGRLRADRCRLRRACDRWDSVDREQRGRLHAAGAGRALAAARKVLADRAGGDASSPSLAVGSSAAQLLPVAGLGSGVGAWRRSGVARTKVCGADRLPGAAL
ncbi:MAG: hypothetical protein AVDCRST_MAG90-2617, partial [uncultured Microvirga sp.]